MLTAFIYTYVRAVNQSPPMNRGNGAKNGIFFECFPYVCPEPVFVKVIFF
jgi:hypothetical protein